MRELFELYQYEDDPIIVEQLIKRGWKHIETFRSLADIDQQSLDSMFLYMASPDRKEKL